MIPVKIKADRVNEGCTSRAKNKTKKITTTAAATLKNGSVKLPITGS